MRRRTFTSSSTRRIIAGLLGISFLLFILPTTWTGGLISLVQLLVPMQDAAKTAGDAAARALPAGGPSVIPAAEFASEQRQRAAFQHQTAALAARVEELEREVALLTATRLWDAGGRRIGSKGRLIPARVITSDVLPWRSSRLIGAGSLQGVPPKAAVVSNAFTVEPGESAGVREGLAILLGEAVVGVVEQVGTHTARVKLLSDPDVQMKVRVGRFTDGSFSLADSYFWLVGRGGGRMEIRDVEKRWTESGAVTVGDVVVSDSAGEFLPAAMTIGKISEVVSDRDNPLFVQLSVEPAVAECELQRVYVFDPQAEPPS